MTTLEILAALKRHKVIPRLVSNELKLTGETSNLPEELIEQVRKGKAELMSFLISASDEFADAAIPPIPIQQCYPASNAQKRIWVLSQFEGGTAAYNITTSLYLKGVVDKEQLNKAFESSVQRHESLRTVFTEAEGELKQVVLEDAAFEMEFEDVSERADTKEYVTAEITRFNNWQFDLENGPLIKVTLLRLSKDEFALIMGLHHIISDGWSITALLQEVMHFYQAYCKNEDPVIAPLKIHYKDYSSWLNQRINGRRGQYAKEFWKSQFPTDVDPLILPSHFTRPAARTFEGGIAKFPLGAGFYTSIIKFCRKNHATPFNFLRATLTILLNKFSGQNDITIGTPVAGRHHADLENQIGFYVNTLPLRTEVNSDDTFLEFLNKITAHSYKAFEFQEYPFDRIIDDVVVNQDAGRNPLFDVMLALQDTAIGDGSRDLHEQYGFMMEPLESYLYESSQVQYTGSTSKFDLSFNFGNAPYNKFYLEIEYATQLFSTENITRFFNAYLNIISQVLEFPEAKVSNIDVMDGEERHRIVETFNDTKTVYPSQSTIIHLIEEQVLRTPDNIAIVWEETSLTYKELNENANQLGHYLRKRYNIQADDLIGIKLNRSENMIIAILGVLKSGGAYVPIDPEYPQERIDYIIADSQCKVVIDEQELARFIEDKKTLDKRNVQSINQPTDLAYVIYTSGSTGMPKGVMIENSSLTNLCFWHVDNFSVTAEDRATLYASVSFDAAVWELFPYLIRGACLYIIPNEIRLKTNDLAAYYETNKITISFLPTQIGEQFLQENNTSLRYLLLGGDKLNAVVKQTYQVVNNYGPTENTVVTTSYVVNDPPLNIPIGKPISNTRIYILYNGQQLAPTGVIGEIGISGDGLARGYLNREALTAEKFIANPFTPGERMYMTGDLGRWLADGTIEFLGRKDDQVKIRGYRIELGEIEQALQGHPDIDKAVVLAKSNKAEEKELVGYIVSKETLLLSDIRAHLGNTLPSYMLPAHLVQLDELPLTPNGKIDKKRLPDAEGSGLWTGIEYIAPRNTIEQKLVLIWQEVLGKEKVSVKDDFFDLGGHSLKATRLASQIHVAFEVKLPLKQLFTHKVLEQQAELIAGAKKTSFVTIPVAAQQSGYPLSSSQQRLWILSRFKEGNAAYNMPAAYVFEGHLNRKALAYAFETLIKRHESLQTVFKEDEQGEVRQFINPAAADGFVIEYRDLRKEAEQEEKVSRIVRNQFTIPFDLSAGPLVRAALLHIAENKWVFTCCMHHIISDGWSMGIFINELLAFYNACAEGKDHQLPSLRIHYKDYAVWQHEQFSGEALMVHKDYWLKQLEGDLPVLELSADKVRPVVKTYNGGITTKRINAELSKGLHAFVQEQESTLFMGLLAAVNALLYRYTSQEDIIIGTQIAGREHADLEDQIGNYLNTLALRTRFTGNNSYRELLEAVRQVSLEAYAHQQYPFDELVDALPLRYDMSRHPLFDVSVILQNAQINKQLEQPDLAGIKVSGYEGVEDANSKFDLAFDFIEVGEEIQVNLVYNTDIYHKSTAEQFVNHLHQLLEVIIACPDRALNELEFLSRKEQEQQLIQFNDSATAYPRGKTIVNLFEEQARQTPDRVAVVFEDRILTYKELNERSDQLAGYLVAQHDVRANDLIGIMLNRSEKVLVAILGILKSGAAYVPIDPDYPEARKEFIFNDTSAKVLITQTDYIAGLAFFKGTVFDIDTPLDTIKTFASKVTGQPTDLAYVMYTSGSTGNPKGVMVEHRSVVRLVKSANYVSLTEDNILLSTGALSFDATSFEYWGMLLNGGQLVMCPQEVLMDSRRLQAEISKRGVNIMWFTSGWLNQLVDSDIGVFKGLKTILAGGDKLSLKHINGLVKTYPGIKIINGYGPTENTTFSLTYSIEKPLKHIPVGKPISNSTAYIINDKGVLQPVGAVGEICVGGTGLARGYLNNAGLTSAKFVQNPFSPGERMYKTGDLGRWQRDGNIEFIGRKDDQVKIRGYRIELGEIERALQSHQHIDSAVVIATMNESGEKDLIAYIVSSEILNTTDVRKYISGQLPAYMLPAHFVQLDELPLNSNGKVDKKRLPDYVGFEMATSVEYIPPRNETEEKLAEIWHKILGKERISVKDNFFELGGHSLKANRLASQILKEFEVKIEFQDLFIHAVLEEQAGLIANARKTEFIRIPSVQPQPHYVLSSSQRRLWVLSQLEEGNIAYNISGAYVLEGQLDREALMNAFNTLIARHEILRTVFKEDEQGEIRQYIKSVETTGFAIGYCDLRHDDRPEERLNTLVRQEFMKAFNLSEGPLVRAHLFQVADSAWVFSCVMQHIISDGWSMGVLINEVVMFYNAFTRLEDHSLQPLRIHYKDYAVWQQEQLEGGLLKDDKAYWLNQFAGELPVLELPVDKVRPAMRSYKGGVINKLLDPQAGNRLKAINQDEGATLFMGLLAAINVLLYRYTSQEDLVIGSPVAGREHVDLEDQIGFYVNTLALRTQCKGTDSFRTLLKHVKQMTLEAYDHQAYPFDELVSELDLQRDMSRHPLFDVMVVLQNTENNKAEESHLGEVKISRYEAVTEVISKFDLLFNFTEREDTIQVSIEYNSDIYNSSTIAAMGDHLVQLVGAIVEQSSIPIQDIDYLSTEEKHRLLADFNDTVADFPADKTLTGLFEEQVAKTPDSIALFFNGKEFTFSELNERSNQLAHYLKHHYTIQPDDLIGIKLERSEWMIISILAVLKSGGAYVPIDPEYPQDRISYMLTDSRCKVLIDDQELLKFKNERKQYEKTNLHITNKPTDLAYVIYTSGSTGKPKGCMLEHRGIVNRLEWMYRQYAFSSKDIILQKTTFTFDVSVWEIFTPLCRGVKMVLCHKDDVASPDRIASLIKTQKVTCLHFVPSMLNAFMIAFQEDENARQSLSSLRLVITSGEALPVEYVKSWYKKFEVPIHNLYGPTEASVEVTYYATSEQDNIIPIGRPIGNTQIYIVGKANQLQPLGVAGEICISGIGLARGYLNQPELSAQKFVKNPFREGERMYKTGDVGRWLPDGNIAYLGRIDDQVKVRGYRIEMGEIEKSLQTHSGIDNAVVLAKSNKTAEKELVAYIISKGALNTSEIRDHLSKTLPSYMIPTHWVQIEALPLTPNGKIDKKRLPEPEGAGPGTGIEYIAPRNTTEQKLVLIWQEILEKEKVGVKDNFFDLGGHSLKATRLVSRIHKEFEVKIPLKELFANTVLEQQAHVIQRAGKTRYINIPHAVDQEYYALSSAQKRLFFLHEFAPESTGYNMPGIQYLGKTVDKERMLAVLRQLIVRHENLRTSFEKINGVAWQKIHQKVVFDLDEYECLPAGFNEYMHSFIRPFDLSAAPLLRSSLVNIKGIGYVWMVDIHHIVADGTSVQILIDDFIRLYRGEELPELTLQYKDFSEWQNKMIESGEQDSQKEYWLSQFSSGIPRLNFPADRSRPATFTFEGARYEFTIPPQLTSQLRTLGNQHAGTLQMTLLSVLNVLLYKYTGQDDMVIGCGIAGRRHPDVESIVGMFVNSLAIRNFPQGDKRFAAFYKEVIGSSVAAYENQDVQFEDLLNIVNVEREPSRNPVFDIAMVVQNFTKSKTDLLELAGMDRASESDLHNAIHLEGPQTAKFDMTWFVHERDEDILIDLEYYSAIYDRSRIERLVGHFINTLKIVIDNPDILLSEVNVMTEADEQELLNNFVRGENGSYPSNNNLYELFETQCVLTPDNISVKHDKGSITYRELNERSNQLARFLVHETGLQIEDRVGILQTRSKEFPVSVLGVLKAGGAYVPLDTEYPEERLLYMLEDAGIEVLLTEKNLIELANRIQWRCKGIKHLVCVDSEDIYKERGALRNELMRKDLWDHVGDTATDAITGGGWMSSYTGEYLSETEMQEYAENAYLKLKSYLRPDMKVLEIGCSSGLTMLQIAPHVAKYHGTDLSSSILSYTGGLIKEKGYTNIALTCLPAHEIDQLEEGDFDIVIINSVIQSFNGHNYLRDVLIKTVGKIKETGLLFLGDIMDEDSREALIGDLTTFKQQNKDKGYRTKTDWSSELFLSRDYLSDLVQDGIGIVQATFSDKIHTVSNELTRYRYDALLRIDKQLIRQASIKKKCQYDISKINTYSADALQLPVQPGNLAYIIYTSGSTGKPKGVMVEHGSVINYISWALRTYIGKEQPADFALFTSPSFDLTVTSIFMPLLSGGAIHVYDVSLEMADLLRLQLQNGGVENIKLTPSHINLIENIGLRQSNLKKVIVGGEELREAHINILRNLNPDIEIYNEYGPTEATVGCIVWKVTEHFKQIMIGRQIMNTSIYLINNEGGLAPIGVTGEICIGGDCLARGYLNKPDLTQEKFIINPYNSKERLYRTGDLGRWLPDGNIEFLGRRDEQVKIRGYRIELGEIETVLQKHQDIDAAVVAVKFNTRGEKELVAYLVSKRVLNIADLRAYLGSAIPVYMLPGHYVQLEKLPLTTNGKVDKNRLPGPEGVGLASGISYIAPRNAIEEKLVSIWEEILGKHKIGIKDNFFDLGGHSLKATRLASLIHKEFEVKVPLKELFTNIVLEQQARLIRQARRSAFSDILPVPVQPDYPLSPSQRRLWVLSLFDEGNMAYNMPGVYVFEGELDLTALMYAFNELIKRHEILRTLFKENEQGDVRQYILSPSATGFKIDQYDLRHDPERLTGLHRLVQEEIFKPFDLTTGPLLRAGLYRVANNKWIFTYVMHHIIGDGWSMGILIKELLLNYNACIKGISNLLPPLRIQYKDYAAWQLEQLSEDTSSKHKDYWLNQFEGELPVLELPYDKIRPAVKTYNGGIVNRIVNATVSSAIKELSQQQGGTLFMGLLATVNALLYRYTNQEDIIIGTPIAGREHIDLENQIGFYINTLALRARFNGNNSYAELLEHIKQVTLEAYEHQLYPFDELVDELKLQRDMSRSALFDVMVVLQNADIGNVDGQQLDALTINEYSGLADKVSKFDLCFNFTEWNGELQLRIEYNSDIYATSTVERLADHLNRLMELIVAHPSVPIQLLDYLSAEEKQQLIAGFNDTAAEYPKDKTVVHLFEEQVAMTPAAIALICGEVQLSYQRLNEQSNKLANYLRQHYNIQPDDLIGIKLERSEWMIIAILGVLKSGGAYVPVDIEYPQDRIDYIIADSQCKVLIDEDELEKFRTSGNRYTGENLPLVHRPHNLAYVIYTSGTTGMPKGAMIEHRSLAARIIYLQQTYAITEADNLIFYRSYSFDGSIEEYLMPVMTGAKCYIAPRDFKQDILNNIIRFVERNKITKINMPPVVLGELVLMADKNVLEKLSSLKHVVSGGDMLTVKIVNEFLAKFTASLYNSYGPTENTIDSTNWLADRSRRNANVPIGKPVQNSQVYILDNNLQLVPVGICGELYVSGAGLGRGYLNNPELSAEKFIPDPFTPGGRMYKTGDLGKWLADGNIEFIGRKDNQVKIRGYRIEIGEIENALQSHPDVESAVVIARRNRDSDKELVAYVISKGAINVPEIRSYMSKTLPTYMLPAYFVQLDSLPLTHNGKLDRRKLPDPEGAGMAGGVEYVAPRNEIEEKLVSIWQEILGKERIGVKDNFFELGGHSLKVAQLISRINMIFLVRINIQSIFQEPVIENIGEQITFILEQQKQKQKKSQLIQIEI